MDGPADVIPLRYFSDLPDPSAANVRHRLIDLLVMSLCATICGADGWDDFADFADAKAMAAAIRGHWSIENGLHHVLDVSFREDDSRIRKDHGAENMGRLRRMAMNVLRVQCDKHTKRKSIKG